MIALTKYRCNRTHNNQETTVKIKLFLAAHKACPTSFVLHSSGTHARYVLLTLIAIIGT